MATTRREFIQAGLAGTSLLATGWTLPGFLTRTAAAAARSGAAGADERVLVVIQLSGGNDGLNTVIPVRSDDYQRARPTLRVAPERALHLSDDLSLHPDMTSFKRLYDDGMLHVVTNVGYPNPDRSHFRSMDIWHTASAKPEDVKDGWLGRVVDTCCAESETPCALHVDDEALPLALKTQLQPVPSIRGIDAFRLTDAQTVESALAGARQAASDDLLYVQRVAISSCASARRLEQIASGHGAASGYPGFPLASRLRQIAQLIGAGFGARVYYTSLGGFDTHARQALSHGPLLRELSDSIAAMLDDLKRRGLADRVVVMTFSEFGRRVKENGSQGTDHGAAAPMFVAGGPCRAGISGGPIDLSNLDEGDVRHTIDFRSVYATLLDEWLGVDHRAILGARYQIAPILA